MSNNMVQFNEEIIKGQIRGLVRGSVEETLNESRYHLTVSYSEIIALINMTPVKKC